MHGALAQRWTIELSATISFQVRDSELAVKRLHVPTLVRETA